MKHVWFHGKSWFGLGEREDCWWSAFAVGCWNLVLVQWGNVVQVIYVGVFGPLVWFVYVTCARAIHDVLPVIRGRVLLEAEVKIPCFVDPLKLVVRAGLLSSLGQRAPRWARGKARGVYNVNNVPRELSWTSCGFCTKSPWVRHLHFWELQATWAPIFFCPSSDRCLASICETKIPRPP